MRLATAPNGNAPAIDAAIPSVTARHPAIVGATSAGPGGKLAFDVLASKGELSEVWVSLPGYAFPFPIPGTGTVWIDPSSPIVLGRFSVGASERLSFSLAIPNVSVLRGMPLTIQALAGSANGFRFSTPATVVLD